MNSTDERIPGTASILFPFGELMRNMRAETEKVVHAGFRHPNFRRPAGYCTDYWVLPLWSIWIAVEPELKEQSRNVWGRRGPEPQNKEK